MSGAIFLPRRRGGAEQNAEKSQTPCQLLTKPALLAALLLALPLILSAQPADYTLDNAQQFLKQYCQACHQGNSPAAGFDIQKLSTASSIQSEAERWNKVALRVKNGEMPPKAAPAPPVDQREQFTQWATSSVRAVACSAGVASARSP